jgi:hypothetical protein
VVRGKANNFLHPVIIPLKWIFVTLQASEDQPAHLAIVPIFHQINDEKVPFPATGRAREGAISSFTHIAEQLRIIFYYIIYEKKLIGG